MAAELFDYAELLRPDLPPAAAKWTGFPKYNFVGGHNDADSVPVEGLIAAATSVLKREGSSLSTYGLQSGPLGYRPLREFIARKLANDAGIACSPDEILITSGSLQGLDLVNQVLLSPGDTVIVEQMTYGGAITRLKRLDVNIVGVEVDHDGLSSDGLKTALDDLKRRGIRPKYMGYLVAGWPLMSRILGIKSDGGSGALEQMILAEYCRDHFESHVRTLRKTLRRKLDVMIEALRTQFGEAAEFDDPAGGIFLWVKLPDSVDTTRLTQLALQSGVAINPGAEWMTDALAGQTRLRLCFAHPREQVIREGVARLAEVCHHEFAVPARSAKGHR